MSEEVDVVVIGLGVGGETVVGELVQAGLRVVAIEGELVGGECPYWACIPSKMMIRAADLVAEARRVDGMAGQARVSPEWKPVAARIRDEATSNWDDQVAVDRLVEQGAQFVRGWATLAGPGEVDVGNQRLTTRRGVVLGAGAKPVIPPIDGLAGTPYWTNRQAIEADTAPSSLIVLGGGAVGVELAQVFARFGARVDLVEAGSRLLPMEEPEASAVARRALEADGISVHTSVAAERVDHDGSRFVVSGGAHGSKGLDLSAERLLVSVGRRANLAPLGVANVGLDPGAPAVPVDEHLRAGERLWAVGDITGHGAFTHVATYQGAIAARDILGVDGPPADYRAVPRVTFTDPEIGAVGMTEAQARESGRTVVSGQAEVPSTARGWIHKAGSDGVIKLVGDAERGVLVGATAAGPGGGEVLGALAVAVHGEVGVSTLRHMIYAYPTFHRGIEDALGDLG